MQVVCCDVKIWKVSLSNEKASMSKMVVIGVTVIKARDGNLVKSRGNRVGNDVSLKQYQTSYGDF